MSQNLPHGKLKRIWHEVVITLGSGHVSSTSCFLSCRSSGYLASCLLQLLCSMTRSKFEQTFAMQDQSHSLLIACQERLCPVHCCVKFALDFSRASKASSKADCTSGKPYKLDEELLVDLWLAEDILHQHGEPKASCRDVICGLLQLRLLKPQDVEADSADCFIAYSEASDRSC